MTNSFYCSEHISYPFVDISIVRAFPHRTRAANLLAVVAGGKSTSMVFFWTERNCQILPSQRTVLMDVESQLLSTRYLSYLLENSRC